MKKFIKKTISILVLSAIVVFLGHSLAFAFGDASTDTMEGKNLMVYGNGAYHIVYLDSNGVVETRAIKNAPELMSRYNESYDDVSNMYWAFRDLAPNCSYTFSGGYSYDNIVWAVSNPLPLPSYEELSTLWAKIRPDILSYNIDVIAMEDINKFNEDSIKIKEVIRFSDISSDIFIGIREDGSVVATDRQHAKNRYFSDLTPDEAPNCSLGSDLCKQLNTIVDLENISVLNENCAFGVKKDGTTFPIFMGEDHIYLDTFSIKKTEVRVNSDRIDALSARIDALSELEPENVITANYDTAFNGVKVDVHGTTTECGFFVVAKNSYHTKYLPIEEPIIDKDANTIHVLMKKTITNFRWSWKWWKKIRIKKITETFITEKFKLDPLGERIL